MSWFTSPGRILVGGYTKIEQACHGMGIHIDRTTVAAILKDHGNEPAPKRGVSWREFIARHWQTLSACDFFTVDALSWTGPVRYHVFFVIHLQSRAVHVEGITAIPDRCWMENVARSLVDDQEGALREAKCLFHGRDPLFTKRFRQILESVPALRA